MKKIHLIAAAAALLLSGGVFLKTSQNDCTLLNSNIIAFSEDGNGYFGEPVPKNYELTGYPAYAHVYPVGCVDPRGALCDENGNGTYTGWGCGPTTQELYCAEVNGTVEIWR